MFSRRVDSSFAASFSDVITLTEKFAAYNADNSRVIDGDKKTEVSAKFRKAQESSAYSKEQHLPLTDDEP